MIYTFYSYKGGVGRSMALANIAETLHEKGLRVIMIDWDLEAPGLETFFCGPNGERQLGELRAHEGLIDMLVAYRNAYPAYSAQRAKALATTADPNMRDSSLQESGTKEQERTAELTKKVLEEANVPAFRLKRIGDTAREEVPKNIDAFLDRLYRAMTPSISPYRVGGTLADSPFGPYLQCVHEPDKEHNGVYLLSAGARSDQSFNEYAAAVQDFGWSDFYATYDGREYFAWFRDQLKAVADVILIDSRTGVTEMGGVCTRHLPDAVISFCAPNFQNVDGVVRVVAGLNKDVVKRARDDRSIATLIIPTRIDNSESDRLNDFSKSFADKVEHRGFIPEALRDSERPLWNLQIPYIPRYNYREERVIGPDIVAPDPATQKLIDAYRKIAVHLAILSPEGSRLRGVFASEIQLAVPLLSKVAPQLAPAVSDSWVERPSEYQTLKATLLQLSTSSQLSRLAVCGSAGTGKTTLVARICRDPEIVEAYPAGILWLNARQLWTAELAQEWLRTMLGVSRHGGEPGLRQALMERRFLLVADDVWSPNDIEEVLKYGAQCTQMIITRDAGVASHFGEKVHDVGGLTIEQSLRIIETDAISLAEPSSPRYQSAQELVALPLGAVLVRAALARHLSQGATPTQAWKELGEAFDRHGIVAFDQLEGADSSTSIAISLKETISRLKPDEESLLIRIAKWERGQKTGQEQSHLVFNPPVQLGRLDALGLVSRRADQITLHPLIRAYLLVEGRLDERLDAKSRESRISSSADKQEGANPHVERAKQIIRGESAGLDEIQVLAENLKQERYFTYARQLFALAQALPETKRQSDARRLRLIQRQALCTYRDLDLPSSRFGDALELLERADLSAPQPSSETLGLAGAICKYQWKLTGRRRDLERSIAYYRIGAVRNVTDDEGYTAINAAFMLDILAQQERDDAPDEARHHADQARTLRGRITTQVRTVAEKNSSGAIKNNWWLLATLAEAYFGLGGFSEARFWLREGLALNPADWELESTTRQLCSLAVAQKLNIAEGSEVYRTLRVIFGDAKHALLGATIGKIGLALSGGGFRASLFHIGVLARMAELDMLRYVEVLSCVSGGSIVGAHYYLEVRRLLQEKSDSEITRADYIQMIQRLERDFLSATQKNLRLRLFTAWWVNFLTLIRPAYTRTTHLGWLFEKYIFSRVLDGYSNGRRWLNELQITPKGGSTSFNPKLDNWARSAKAPILLLNATTLNTGHNWQFAVSWMGEPPLGASSPIDRNDILRRMYYWEAPLAYQRIALGEAVAASACVPSLFDPVEFRGLYPDRVVRFIDGGTHDNQGIVGLLEQECTVLVVSDASGQTGSANQPSDEILSVAFRANNILMARAREAEYREVDLLRRSLALNGLAFLHLKKDLEASQIDWVDCQDQNQDQLLARNVPLTTYGMPRSVQSRLAAIRTDLDSFSDMEAYSLMLSGYRMMTAEVQKSFSHLPFSEGEKGRWNFLAIQDVALRTSSNEPQHFDMLKQLGVSANQLFKVWRLRPALKYLVLAAFLSIGLVAAYGVRSGLSAFCSGSPGCGALVSVLGPYAYGSSPGNVSWLIVGLTVLFGLAVALFGIVATSIFLWLVHRAFRDQKSITVIATGLMVITVGWIVALLHLHPLNWLYLQRGRVRVRPDHGHRS
ncbi:MAG: hypothetical protein QOH65_673 [Methylobacteriaceae bacterium]|jgi:predicted acylesterase/phospholipase RssA|nr:hypothetical protein [Methylobacteriaceae bacterium]